MYAFFTSAPVALGEMPKVEYKSDSEDEDDKGAILSLLECFFLLLLSPRVLKRDYFRGARRARCEDSLSLSVRSRMKSKSALVFFMFLFFFQNALSLLFYFV
jgi:hypothetical protein